MTPYEIHELIVEDIEENSFDLEPCRIDFPAGHKVPEGTYTKNENGLWVREEET